MTTATATLDRSQEVLLGVFGRPRLTLVRGEGCHVWDADGRRYLDLLGGIAVSSLGHGHPALVEAISRAARELVHVSNFFVTPDQVRLGERLLELAGAPDGSRVFLCNSGTEAIEAVVKLARRTGRRRVVAAEGAFHGRSTGALALTHKQAYREPFEPLMSEVTFVPYGDTAALRAAVDETVAAVVLEPIQGEAGVIPASGDYLRAAREATTAAGALLVLDEIQTGVGRTGRWFAHQEHGIRPDVMTLAKGLAGGVPIGAVVTYGDAVSGLLGPGQHGTTFGGNALACAAALAVLDTIERDGLLQQAAATGEHLAQAVTALGHPGATEVRGAGLLRAIGLAGDVSAQVTAALEASGLIVNPVRPDAIRVAPPLILTTEQADELVAALPAALDRIASSHGGPS
ncbi:acetylornithine transaminase [Arsenicicoccus sp. oral taxon 190]|uniref:acetylornithine transaminase n=1 Tax=Arsenicicoccus sp. oral taxon 190 TaxID=1658671 RepID=UPI00067A15F5|nr:acetylornithine transaminase [Arsenicicoccus sp. oral taxon 190]AKT51672.1 acetylornithine aminotransferase [Arsenicicoccus sp. oral taxon 190]